MNGIQNPDRGPISAQLIQAAPDRHPTMRVDVPVTRSWQQRSAKNRRTPPAVRLVPPDPEDPERWDGMS